MISIKPLFDWKHVLLIGLATTLIDGLTVTITSKLLPIQSPVIGVIE